MEELQKELARIYELFGDGPIAAELAYDLVYEPAQRLGEVELTDHDGLMAARHPAGGWFVWESQAAEFGARLAGG
jgi:hypothetical protein